jgi:hypothetical protein
MGDLLGSPRVAPPRFKISCPGRGFRHLKLEMPQSCVTWKVVVAVCKRTWSLVEKGGEG